MKAVMIKSTNYSPFICFNQDGNLLIEGKSIPKDSNSIFLPLFEFASQIRADKVVFDINLEYFNTATTKRLLKLINIIDNNSNVLEFIVKWHHVKDDTYSIELANIFEECQQKAKFQYIMHNSFKELYKLKIQKQLS